MRGYIDVDNGCTAATLKALTSGNATKNTAATRISTVHGAAVFRTKVRNWTELVSVHFPGQPVPPFLALPCHATSTVHSPFTKHYRPFDTTVNLILHALSSLRCLAVVGRDSQSSAVLYADLSPLNA